ncbi:phage holin family protein [Fusobacterium mortiferum]|uniref:phage holin family protein n=1 Tax=Fusobacterium mortiferum TaxID=850 RepID=UPI001F442072|nr:phage holin family protein [Fusobacterium mortiferum]MCF2627603.1 phage holin family protein [Fusobacterium mortiferum]
MTFTEVLELFVDVGNILINKLMWVLGGILSLIFLITGGEDKMVECLSILMLIDYITGVAKAVIIEKVNSKAGFKGLLKKMVMISVVVLAYQIDLLFDGKFAIKSLTVGILLSNEGLSILENASICGVPIPEKLKNMLEQYKESKNKNP